MTRDWSYVMQMIGTEDGSPQNRRWVVFRNVFGSDMARMQFLGAGGKQRGESSLMCVLLHIKFPRGVCRRNQPLLIPTPGAMYLSWANC